MNIPLKNKEELDEKDIYRVSRLKYRLAIIVAALGVLTTLITAVVPLIKEVLISDEAKKLKKFKEDVRYEKFKDSILDIQDLKTQEETYKDISRINELVNELRKELPLSAQISIYFTHDSGGVPVTGSPLHVTMLYAANNIEPCLDKNYWQGKIIPVGYFNYNYRVYKQKFYYTPDITKEPDIYIGEIKDDIDCNQNKSIMGTVLKETGYATYFLSVSWQEENVLQRNYKSRLIIKKYASYLEPLIKGKQRHL